VKAFLAMGDSITAAFGAKELFKLDGIREFRGLSWSIGGDDGAYTLPNFFARVSGSPPKAPLGASLGVQIPLEAVKIKGHPVRDWNPRVDQLNGAVSLAKVQDLDAQMDYLVAEAKKIEGLNFDNDWKVLTILIGANNLCASCEPNRSDTTPEFFASKYRAILERARNEIPRVFVNAVPMFNISGVYAQQQTSDYCKLIKRVSDNECPCMGQNAAAREAMDLHNVMYTRSIHNIAADYAAKNYSEFAVVVQPCFQDLPVLALEYLSGVDCFHPSHIAHAAMGVGVWNNMMQEEGQKDQTLDPASVKILCPSGGC
jgi:phospholipase B1